MGILHTSYNAWHIRLLLLTNALSQCCNLAFIIETFMLQSALKAQLQIGMNDTQLWSYIYPLETAPGSADTVTVCNVYYHSNNWEKCIIGPLMKPSNYHTQRFCVATFWVTWRRVDFFYRRSLYLQMALPANAYMPQKTGLSMVQLIAIALFLQESKITYYRQNQKQRTSVK